MANNFHLYKILKTGFGVSLIFSFSLLFSQPSFRFYTTANGLPSNQIYNLFRDSKGFLWMGHSLGLTRFDGNRFTDYSTPAQNSLGISNIHEDKNGTLWCHNFGGQIFYIKNNLLQVFERYNWKMQQSFPSIAISGKNELIASHINGIYVYAIDEGKDTILGSEMKLGLGFNFGFANIRGEVYTILDYEPYHVTKNRLIKLKPLDGQNFRKIPGQLIIGSFKDSMYVMTPDRSKVIVAHIEQDSYRIARVFNAPDGTFFLSTPNENEAWICAKNISFCINNPERKIDDLNVTAIVSDKEDNLWISTLQNGIGLWQETHQKTHDIKPGNKQTEIINALSIWRNGIVSASSHGQLAFYDSTGKLLHANYLPDNISVSTLQSIDSNSLLIGSNYLMELVSPGKRVRTISSNSAIKSICTDDKGNYYVANAYTLDKVSPDGSLTKLRTKRCFSVKFSPTSQTIYTAFIDGIYGYDGTKIFELKPAGKSIYSPSISVNEENLFAATISEGVYWFKSNRFHKHLSTKNGLLDNHILKLRHYDKKLWILTSTSIEEWDYENDTISHHTFDDDLSLSNITDFVVWKNQIWAAYGNTIKILPAASKKSTPPDVFIDYVLVNDRDTLVKDEYELNYLENQLSFVLSGLSFKSGNKLNFAYRLIGSDSVWNIIPASNHKIEFPGLQPGNYEFEVKAIGSDGKHGKIKTFRFFISNPWWQQPGFIFISVVVLFALVYLIFTTRIRSIRQTNRLILEKINLESQWRESMLTAIRSQMNPHFIFNALNAIQSYIYSNNKFKASQYLGKFSDLIRRILDYSQKEKISLSKEIEMLQLYIDLEIIRFENNMKASIYVDEALDTEIIQVPPMLVQPYVENAIKHGLLHKQDERELNLRFEKDETGKYLLISIEDNGIGRTESHDINLMKRKSHVSFATMANRKRIEMLNLSYQQKFEVDIVDKKDKDDKPLGTLVLLRISL